MATTDIGALVREHIEDILGDPIRRAELLGTSPFGPDQQDMLDYHDSVIRSLLADQSLGRILNGPLWLSGASVVDGTVTAQKISVNTLEAITIDTGSLRVTGTIVAAASFPATGARIEINSLGLRGYSGAATTTFKLNIDGSGEIGTGTNKITWTTGGVLTVPAAVISSLTIAYIGSGVIGGTYQTSTGTTRLELASTGLVAYASGVETFRLNATTGAMTATGSFTIQSATTGARIVISSAGGMEGFNASSTRTFFVNVAAGSGQLGAGTNTISWDSAGSVAIGGVSLSSGKITASHLSVSNLSAISANLGTITAGTITGGTITATAITTGTMNADRISGGNLGGSFSLGGSNINITGIGAIVNSDGDRWDSTGLTLVSSGSFGDAIKWLSGGSQIFSIFIHSDKAYLYRYLGSFMAFTTNSISLYPNSTSGTNIVLDPIGMTLQLHNSYGFSKFSIANAYSDTIFEVQSSGRVCLFPDATNGVSTGWSSVSGLVGTWAIYNTSNTLVGYIPIYSSRS